ncbi:hypothetical protein [Rheinheimera sp. MMS21-TC3]|uniref:hypothetical protein n=1 Tax=Rheinheimera sp. MMS21-TC3 TaxID=3072790 RepID=UPI0028C37DF7|nr:hypothetical protein [Rheinheimera sp. MMS21-TC3]WNO59551.1 hypothetical protein RDV63_00860 [Rheinheimera sp. MMS21-TC3]
MSDLNKFIAELATNPKLQQDYATSPAQTLESYGLQSHEIEAVLSGDKVQLEKLTGKTGSSIKFYFPVK